MNLANTLRNTLAAVALGVFGIGITSQAHAVAMYGADALVQVTLSGVSGGTLGPDVIATYQNRLREMDATSTGTTSWAVADPYLYPPQPIVQDMQVSNTMEHDHIVVGEAGPSYGTAFSFLQSDGYIYLENTSSGTVTFDFEYLVRSNVSAGVTGAPYFADAFANAIIEIFDDSFAFVDISKSISASLASGVLNDSIDQPGTFSVMLQPSESSYINVLVDTSGGATYVPEPGTLALFSAGLIGFAARRRRVPA